MKPLRSKVLLEVDPERREVGEMKILLAPEQDWIRYCVRCGAMMEGIEATRPCTVTEEWKIDIFTDRPVLTNIHASHKIEAVRRDVIVENCRMATVLATGPQVKELTAGDRVLIYCQSGMQVPGSPYRLVDEAAVLGWVEVGA